MKFLSQRSTIQLVECSGIVLFLSEQNLLRKFSVVGGDLRLFLLLFWLCLSIFLSMNYSYFLSCCCFKDVILFIIHLSFVVAIRYPFSLLTYNYYFDCFLYSNNNQFSLSNIYHEIPYIKIIFINNYLKFTAPHPLLVLFLKLLIFSMKGVKFVLIFFR